MCCSDRGRDCRPSGRADEPKSLFRASSTHSQAHVCGNTVNVNVSKELLRDLNETAKRIAQALERLADTR